MQELCLPVYRAKLRAPDPTHGGATMPRVRAARCGCPVDVTLVEEAGVEEAGVELDLGCPVDAIPEVSGGTCYTDRHAVTGQAAAHRRALIEAFADA